MDTFKAFNWLTDKRHGFGLPMNVLARYCGVHPSTLTYHQSLGGPVTPEAKRKYDEALQEMIADFKKYVMGEE